MDFLSNYQGNDRLPGRRILWISLGLLLVLGAVGTAAYFYVQNLDLKKNNPAANAQKDTQETVAAVSRLIVLPTDEQPTVATVTDPTKLGSQSFFAHAKVGDKVLLYAAAKKAILYDPSINKIVEVAPLDLSDSNAPAGSTNPPTVSGTSTDSGNSSVGK